MTLAIAFTLALGAVGFIQLGTKHAEDWRDNVLGLAGASWCGFCAWWMVRGLL